MTNETKCPKCGAGRRGYEGPDVVHGGWYTAFMCGTATDGIGGISREGRECLRRQLDARDKTIADLGAAIKLFLKWENDDDNKADYMGQEDIWMEHTERLAAALAGLAELRKEQRA